MAPVALVYGGSGGIGSATARLLRVEGWTTHLAGRNKDALEAVGRELDARVSVGDVADPAFFERATADAGERIDGLLYAVGTIRLGGVHRLTEQDYLDDFRINASGAALAVKAALPALRKADGTASVVLFSSIAATQGFPLHASMGMAKGAVAGLTLALAAELAPKVRVNAVAPSLVRTPLAEKLLPNATAEQSLARLHPAGRLGAPEDVAVLAAFLLSTDAAWITGQVVAVDGGRSTLRPKG